MKSVNLRQPALLGCVLLSAPLLSAAPIDYVREIKPILAENCYRCHGASQQKGGLRMDTAATAKKGGDAGALFEPGKAEGSLLVKVITGKHEDIARMPYKKPPLSETQIALLKQWVE